MLLLLGTFGCGSIGIGDEFDSPNFNPPPPSVGGDSPAAAGGSDTQGSGGSVHAGGSAGSGGQQSVTTGGDPSATGGAALSSGGAIASGGGGSDAVGGALDPSGGANTGGAGSDSGGGSTGGGGMDGGGTGGATVVNAPSCEDPGPNHTPFSTALSLGTTVAPGVWALDTEYTENSGTLAWTAQQGHLAPGALELKVVVPFGGGRQVLFPKTLPPDADARGAHFFVHMFIASGEEAKALVFAMSSNYAWMNGEPVDMPVGEWVCLELDVDNPSMSDWDFNPRDVIAVGVQVDRSQGSPRSDTITAYLDDFSF